jgi:hypothetical protein
VALSSITGAVAYQFTASIGRLHVRQERRIRSR